MWRQDLAREIKVLNCLFLSSWVLLVRIVCRTQLLTWQSNTKLNSRWGQLSSVLPGGCDVWACWGCDRCCPAGRGRRWADWSSPPTHRAAPARLLSAPALPPRVGGGGGWAGTGGLTGRNLLDLGWQRGEIIIGTRSGNVLVASQFLLLWSRLTVRTK